MSRLLYGVLQIYILFILKATAFLELSDLKWILSWKNTKKPTVKKCSYNYMRFKYGNNFYFNILLNNLFAPQKDICPQGRKYRFTGPVYTVCFEANSLAPPNYQTYFK